jgi:hypothetical protein
MNSRKLRIAWWALCAIAAALLCLMWVRSYWWIDSLDASNTLAHESTFRLASVAGRTTLTLALNAADDDDALVVYNRVPIDPQTRYLEFWRVLFRIKFDEGRWLISVPYWLSLLAVAALAVAVPRLRWRFTLRTLLIAMAALSLLLWIVISALRR